MTKENPQGDEMADTRWAADKVERRSVAELIPYDRNPKLHPDSQIEQLANSIREWGWTVPILVDEEGVIIAGHGRLYAAQSLGIDEVPVMVAEGWTDVQKKAYVIADNKLAENGGWDTGLYFSELKAIASEEFQLELTGVDIDLTQFDYSPNLEPMTSYAEIEDTDISKANDTLSNSMANAGQDQSNRGVEVMCPNCAHAFKFDGI